MDYARIEAIDRKLHFLWMRHSKVQKCSKISKAVADRYLQERGIESMLDVYHIPFFEAEFEKIQIRIEWYKLLAEREMLLNAGYADAER